VEPTAWIGKTGLAGLLPDVLASLGGAQDELGELEAAAATLSRAITLSERTKDPHSLHISRYKQSRFQYENRLLHEALETAGAEAAWARGLVHDREFGDLLAVVTVNFGRTLVAYGDAARGLVELDRARALLPQKTTDRLGPLLSARADALISLGRLTEAGADMERAAAATSTGGTRVVEAVRVVRRRYLVAIGRADEALQNFRDNPPTGTSRNAFVQLRRQAENAALLMATGDRGAARTAAESALATIERLPERRFARDAEARLTAVLGEALLHEGRIAEALPVLQKSLALQLAQYDPSRSPAVANARLALAKAQHRAGH
jgi:tetratricopeptide (TPR) repeat protein